MRQAQLQQQQAGRQAAELCLSIFSGKLLIYTAGSLLVHGMAWHHHHHHAIS
jgi:hypothetical protein